MTKKVRFFTIGVGFWSLTCTILVLVKDGFGFNLINYLSFDQILGKLGVVFGFLALAFSIGVFVLDCLRLNKIAKWLNFGTFAFSAATAALLMTKAMEVRFADISRVFNVLSLIEIIFTGVLSLFTILLVILLLIDFKKSPKEKASKDMLEEAFEDINSDEIIGKTIKVANASDINLNSISTQAMVGVGFLTSLCLAFANLFGVESKMFINKIALAKKKAVSQLYAIAKSRNAKEVFDVRINISTSKTIVVIATANIK